MENRSKLPKPLTTVHVPVKPPIQSATKPQPIRIGNFSALRRRSKSTSDLRALRGPITQKKFELKKIEEHPIQKKPLWQANPVQNLTTQKIAPKRAAEKNVDEVKAKVSRPQKIPDWDYKTRFNVLNEKHKALGEKMDAQKAKIADFDSMQRENLEIAKNLDTANKTNKNLQNVINDLNLRHTEIEVLVENLRKQITELQTIESEHKNLITEHNILKTKFKHYEEENKSASSTISTLTEQLNKQSQEKKFLKQSLVEQEISRRMLLNTIQDLKGNIRVFCRVRPPIEGEENCIEASINYIDGNGIELKKIDAKQEFLFDQVFGQESTQKDIFEELALLVQSALDGYNVCVFAYGPTGSGKTYTMQGLDSSEESGLIPRAIDLIFETIQNMEKSDWVYEVHASFLEIYNEIVYDLLNSNSKLDIWYNDGKGTTVNNLTMKKIQSAEELTSLMKYALENRRVAATNFNERSSRSHAVSTIYLEGTNSVAGLSYKGSINLVDLAGSESAKYSQDERLAETKYINKSLSALGNVMLSLFNKRKHIPYRDSKLTYLLQSSLGGNSKTLMIVNISPFEVNFSESVTTLRFASKVKEVTMVSRKNKTKLT